MRTVTDMGVLRVAVAVTDGMPLFELAVPMAVFGSPAFAEPWYEPAICAPEGARVGGWFAAEAPYGLDALADADTVIVPACQEGYAEPPGDLVDAVRAAYEAGARVASICTGAFVLAKAGLLDGRRATTHWMHTTRLAEDYPEVEVSPGVLYVDEGRVLTSAGKAAGIDLCLHVVRTDHGTAVANAVARRLVVAPHRPGGQAQFITEPVPDEDDTGLADLLAWAVEHLDEPMTVADLARRVHVSPRHLGRRFAAVTGTTPLQWLLNQRVQRAREYLENTDDGVDLVARRVGMGTAATLRRHFNRVVGLPPDAYRRAYRT